MTEVEWIREDIARVKVPLPFPLRWVNSYLIRGRAGYTLIDPGLHTEESKALWKRALQELAIHFTDIEQIVLTHHHPDHYGLAGWVQEQSGAPVWLSPEGSLQVEAMWKGDGPTNQETVRLFLLHGLEPALKPDMERHLAGFLPQVIPHPLQLQLLDRSQMLKMGDHSWAMVHTPGHAWGHTVFYNEERQELFVGDHVLPRITPNISYIPGTDSNPLQSYLSSLEGMGKFDGYTVYPGHRDPFRHLGDRVQGIKLHHEERLEQMLKQIKEPLSVYALCQAIFGVQLSTHQLRFALAETLAHMIYLQQSGKAVLLEEDEVLRYQSAH
ncbi:MBL fold metallo-hydrolase [Paenibacillus senegalensis]|uniref:MBL fold metallo-hydrolase n=1 Tax=Paenibacillus senegalensis TaxID=1465766 RepID=UPI0002887FC5|nr:MBL fold metallo-hydrolase [Paenibacillus senegalensis]